MNGGGGGAAAPGAERVAGAADDFQAVQVAAAGPGLQQRAEGGRGDQAGFVLAVGQPELPPVPVAGDLHEGGGAGRVADLLDPVPGLQAVLDADVDHGPAFGEAQVLQGDAGQLAGGAVGAVGAQHGCPGEGLQVLADASVHPGGGCGARAGGSGADGAGRGL